ncbi:hypothetical protein ACFP2T_18430 [Plantactinospora solaniradicis]|uniref:DUF3558 domain-containing protein n=1 Tax=Plantactinospora solaniradicis TaxID=1723736 RepID=A0ABW1KCW8_9ACTN
MKRSSWSTVGVTLLLILSGCSAMPSAPGTAPTPIEDTFGRKACEANDVAQDRMQPDDVEVMRAVVADARRSTDKDIVTGGKLINLRIDYVVAARRYDRDRVPRVTVGLVIESWEFQNRCHTAGLLAAAPTPPPPVCTTSAPGEPVSTDREDPAVEYMLDVSRSPLPPAGKEEDHQMVVDKCGGWLYRDPAKAPELTRGHLTAAQHRELLALFADPDRLAEQGWGPLSQNCSDPMMYGVYTPNGTGARWSSCDSEPRVHGAIYRLLAEATPF